LHKEGNTKGEFSAQYARARSVKKAQPFPTLYREETQQITAP